MGKSKTWILLANYADSSLMRNKLIMDLAKEFGLEYSGNSEFVDLYIDGDYQGNYLLTEKVQVSENRVELSNEDGLISEIDNSYYSTEKYYFKSNISNTAFVLKDSVADDEGKENSQTEKAFSKFENYINQFEEALYSKKKEWNTISSMIDVESFIKYYFIQEFSEDPDGCRSSVYMYKDGEEDVIHMGPVWDYDSALGNYTTLELGGKTDTDYVVNIQSYMSNSNSWYTELFKISEFRKLLYDTYNKEIKNILHTTQNKINGYKSEIEKSAEMNFIVWKTLGENTPFIGSDRVNEDTFEGEVQYLSNWVNERVEYLDKRYEEYIEEKASVTYKAHVQDIGDTSYVHDGETIGTVGKGLRLEAINIDLEDLTNVSVKYQVHIQNIGWQDWKKDGELAGTEGQGLRLEAIKINLQDSEKYSIMYRVHVQDIGWQPWKKDGELAGTEGQSLRLEAIEIKIVEKAELSNDIHVKYNSHVENIGWQDYVMDEELSGTTGQSLRVEAMHIELINAPENAKILYRAHIQDEGWQPWQSNGEMIGTTGRNLRVEALEIKLQGLEQYTVEYRVHIQDIGWTDWHRDGEIVGTVGQSKRIEAIEIKLIKK